MRTEVSFLRDVIGLAALELNQRWASFRLGSVTLSLKLVEGSPSSQKCDLGVSGFELSLPVADMVEAVKELQRHNVALLGEPREICSAEGKTYQHVRFLSPNGHCFSFYQAVGEIGPK
jgi:hypothetical protein